MTPDPICPLHIGSGLDFEKVLEDTGRLLVVLMCGEETNFFFFLSAVGIHFYYFTL